MDIFRSWAQSRGNHASVDELAGFSDDFIASFFDQDHQSGRGVVEFAQLINLEEGVHDRWEQLR